MGGGHSTLICQNIDFPKIVCRMATSSKTAKHFKLVFHSYFTLGGRDGFRDNSQSLQKLRIVLNEKAHHLTFETFAYYNMNPL